VLEHDINNDDENEQFVVNFPNEKKQDRIYLLEKDTSNLSYNLICFDAYILGFKTSVWRPRHKWGLKDPETNLYYQMDRGLFGYNSLCENEKDYIKLQKTQFDKSFDERQYQCIPLHVHEMSEYTRPWLNRDLFYDIKTDKIHVVVFQELPGEEDVFQKRYKETGLFLDCMDPCATQVKYVMLLVQPITKFLRPLNIFLRPLKWTFKILTNIDPYLQIGA
jgi:hypothetical protein